MISESYRWLPKTLMAAEEKTLNAPNDEMIYSFWSVFRDYLP